MNIKPTFMAIISLLTVGSAMHGHGWGPKQKNQLPIETEENTSNITAQDLKGTFLDTFVEFLKPEQESSMPLPKWDQPIDGPDAQLNAFSTLTKSMFGTACGLLEIFEEYHKKEQELLLLKSEYNEKTQQTINKGVENFNSMKIETPFTQDELKKQTRIETAANIIVKNIRRLKLKALSEMTMLAEHQKELSSRLNDYKEKNGRA